MSAPADVLKGFTGAVKAFIDARPSDAQMHLLFSGAAMMQLTNSLPEALRSCMMGGNASTQPGDADACLPWLHAMVSTRSIPDWSEHMAIVLDRLRRAATARGAAPSAAASAMQGASLAAAVCVAAAAARTVAGGLVAGSFGPPARPSPAATAAASALSSAMDSFLGSPQLLTTCAGILAALRSLAEVSPREAALQTSLASIAAPLCSMAFALVELATAHFGVNGSDREKAGQWAAHVRLWQPTAAARGGGGGGGREFAHLQSSAAESLLAVLEGSGLLEEIAAAAISLRLPPASAQELAQGDPSLQLRMAATNLATAAYLLAQPAAAQAELDPPPPPLLRPTLALLRGPRLQRLLGLGLERLARDAGMQPDASASASASASAADGPGQGQGQGQGLGESWLLTVAYANRRPAEALLERMELLRAAAHVWLYELKHGPSGGGGAGGRGGGSVSPRGGGGAAVTLALAAGLPGRAARAAEAFARLYGSAGGAAGAAAAASSDVRMVLERRSGTAALALRGLLQAAVLAQERLAGAGRAGERGLNVGMVAAGVWVLAAACCLDLAGPAAASLLQELALEMLPGVAEGFRRMPPAERAAAAPAAARSRLPYALDTCARLAARRGGTAELARALTLEQPLRSFLLPSALEVLVLQPEVASGGGGSSGGGGGGGGVSVEAWRAGEDLGLMVTQAKAARVLCEHACRALGRQGGGSGGASLAEAAAGVAEAAFALWAGVAEACVLCPQVGGRELPRASLSAEARARREDMRAVLVRCAAVAVPPFVRLLDAMAAAYGGNSAAPPLPPAAVAALAKVLAAYDEGSIMVRRIGSCTPFSAAQKLLGPDLLLRMAGAAGRLMAAVEPRAGTQDPAAVLQGLLGPLMGGMGGAAPPPSLPAALLSSLYQPATGLTHAATNPALAPGIWAALRAASPGSSSSSSFPAAATAAAPSGTNGAAAAPEAVEDLRPLLRIVIKLDAKYGKWLGDLESAARAADSAEAFRQRAAALQQRIADDAGARGLNGVKAAWATEAGATEADADADVLEAALASTVKLCSNPLCARFEGACEAEVARKACTGCRRARYCAAECQKEHWREGHKAECKALAAEAAGAGAGGGAGVMAAGVRMLRCSQTRLLSVRHWQPAASALSH
ncbi:hypothetical protein HYH03_008733 [Edaphochlamys debaryana]|uniref:MYND-type domain-containing protein n=1 Tax=Edaphochlamys debaryana TaxID=47281 RepID=A0A835Y5X5_9CHLO|nr:hypothetical protein HYH03_008733 [Edaphochlamys debaryana]|eukprot:KAG2493070.1 hypothetical protein HYH03_008733 [Edaphochlamys debaryana]